MPTPEYYLRQEIRLKEDIDAYYRALIGGYSSAYARTGKRTFLWLSETVRRSRVTFWRPMIEEVYRIREEFLRNGNLIWLTKTLYGFASRQERIIAGIYELISADLPERRSFLDKLSEFLERVRRILKGLSAQYPGTVFGRVIDKQTRQPLEGAKVTMNSSVAVTDKEGKYSFENFPGKYIMTAEMKEYIPQERSIELLPMGKLEIIFELESAKLEITIILRAKTPTVPHYYTISVKSLEELKEALERAKESFRRRFGEADTHDPSVAEEWMRKGREVVERTDKMGNRFWVWKRWSDRKWAEVEKTITVEFISSEDERRYDEWVEKMKKSKGQ